MTAVSRCWRGRLFEGQGSGGLRPAAVGHRVLPGSGLPSSQGSAWEHGLAATWGQPVMGVQSHREGTSHPREGELNGGVLSPCVGGDRYAGIKAAVAAGTQAGEHGGVLGDGREVHIHRRRPPLGASHGPFQRALLPPRHSLNLSLGEWGTAPNWGSGRTDGRRRLLLCNCLTACDDALRDGSAVVGMDAMACGAACRPGAPTSWLCRRPSPRPRPPGVFETAFRAPAHSTQHEGSRCWRVGPACPLAGPPEALTGQRVLPVCSASGPHWPSSSDVGRLLGPWLPDTEMGVLLFLFFSMFLLG